jgi:hypothetical protein
MAHDDRPALLASIEYFTTTLQSRQLDEEQQTATWLLLAESLCGWVDMESTATAGNEAPIEHFEPVEAPPSEQSLSAYVAAIRPLFASLWHLPECDPEGLSPL